MNQKNQHKWQKFIVYSNSGKYFPFKKVGKESLSANNRNIAKNPNSVLEYAEIYEIR